jgi:general secretion pathway protein G
MSPALYRRLSFVAFYFKTISKNCDAFFSIRCSIRYGYELDGFGKCVIIEVNADVFYINTSAEQNGERIMLKKNKRNVRKGFTLVEIMLVLFIIMSIAGMALLAVGQMRTAARERIAQSTVNDLTGKLDLYQELNGTYPSVDEGIEALWTCPPSIDPSVYKQVYKKPVGDDPWGNPYQYQIEGDTVVVFSCGPDGQLGTDDDIRSN